MARVLVIDDDAALRGTVSRMLAATGHEIMEASGGGEALRLLEDNPVNLVLTDLYMPDMDGVEFTIRLSQRPDPPPVIAMSGGGFLSQEAVLDTARRLGAKRTLAKPFTVEQLIEAVDAVLKEPNP